MKQPRLLVHLHVFYPEQAEYFARKLGNVNGVDMSLFITAPKEVLPALKPLMKFKPEIVVVANKGYDILPFIKVLRRVKLDNYDYILKLHTKRTSGIDYFRRGRYFTGGWWRKLLVESLVGSPKIFADNLALLENNPRVGMVGDWYCVRSDTPEEVRNFDIRPYTGNAGRITYIAGTMFLARAEPYGQILKWGISEKDFESTPGWVHSHTFSHLVERLMGFVITMRGYEIVGVGGRNWRFEIASVLSRIRRVVFYTKTTESGKYMIKIFKIPVYNRRIKP